MQNFLDFDDFLNFGNLRRGSEVKIKNTNQRSNAVSSEFFGKTGNAASRNKSAHNSVQSSEIFQLPQHIFTREVCSFDG